MTTAEILEHFTHVQDEQLRNINQMIEASGARTAQSIDEVKRELKKHNGRLTKVEEKAIREEERINMYRDDLTKVAEKHEQEKLDTDRLCKLNDFLEKTSGNKWKALTIGSTVLLIFLLVSTFIYDKLGKLF